ncbi:MAG TPA: AMP-binding protein [Acidimicrobiia bacterium]
MPTIAELVVPRADDASTGLIFEDRSWTWAEVAHECAVRAAMLQAMRRRGRPFHVGVLLDNVPEYVFVLGGAALAGAAVVGINPTRRGAELAHDIRHTDCGLIVTEAAHLPLLDGLDLGVDDDRIVTIESDTWHGWCHTHADASLPTELPGPETLFVLIFTSGSTGAPKAVRGTQGRFAGLGERMPFGPDDVLYCPMPLFHGNALASNFVPALTSGAAIALRRRFSASEFLDDLRGVGATYFNTVGRALSYVLATPPSVDDRRHRVRFGLAPESSPTDAAAFRERFGIPIVGGYGSSEGAIIITPVRDAKAGALGLPPAGADVAVVDPLTRVEAPRAEFDENGRLTNAGFAIGEIVRRDAGIVFEGYYKNEEATSERNRDGWYWSGDLGYRDHEGVFYFAGRTADWMRVDGENFAAAPIERIISRHPDVGAVAVYGVPDPVTGDQVMAAVELRAGRAFDAAGFGAFLDAQRDLGTKWAPRFVRIVDALPVTGADKIAKLPLRAAGWTQAPHVPGEVWWRPERGAGYELLSEEAAAGVAQQFARHGRTALLPPADETSPT